VVAAGTSLGLTSTTLTSVEIIAAGSATSTKLTVDQSDLAAGGSVLGSTGTDTLAVPPNVLLYSTIRILGLTTVRASRTQ
jgi:hypothetical protein